jgi:hypothetical protein
MTEEEFDALEMAEPFRAAGILPEELIMHPEFGALMNMEALRKLTAWAPDQERAQALMKFIETEIVPRFRPN